MNDEYISREDVRRMILDYRADNPKKQTVWAMVISDMLRDLKEIPTADVQPVKRGNWVQIGEQSAKCTECGGVLKSNGIDKTGKALIFNAVYHYCPYCGARMDGDTECQ